MYHPDVVDQRIAKTQLKFGFRLHRYTRDESLYASSLIERKYNPTAKRHIGLTPNEQLFIRNEILLSRCDYRYFTRYAQVLLDDETGAVGPLDLWSAQERLVRKIGEVELRLWQEMQSGRRRLDGNCWFVHKRRQTGASTVCQSIGLHRTALWSDMNGLTAGVDETSTLEKLYNKYYYFMFERLPRWMRPTTTSNSNTGIAFTNGSSVLLQNSTGANVGQGAKWHWTHLTECASWDKNKVSDQIDNHLTNAIAQSIKGMAFLESTSQGIRDWWHLSTELARKHQLPRWNYFFVPWYAIEEISISYPPDDWQPKPDTLAHRDFVERTSPEFMDGVTYHLTREQMYFWETTRYSFEVKGTLAEFYKNYPATPEESFVSTGRASFPLEVLTWHDSNTREPWAYYDILSPSTPSERVITEPVRRADGTLNHPPRIQKFGSIEIGPVWTTEDERRNPLGLIRIWEPPDTVRKHDTYASVDTADGIANWSRHTHKPEDDYLDRAAIEIFRQSHTPDGLLDVQIGEFFAPISPLQTSPYVVALGMLLHGRNALDQQPPVMIELTGGGKTLQEDLIDRYGWFHFYQDFRFNGQEWLPVEKFGWTSTGTSVRQLWTKGKQKLVDIAPACPKCRSRKIALLDQNGVKLVTCVRCNLTAVHPARSGRVILRSRPLVDEMRICEDDAVYMSILSRFARGKAKENSKQHDDLVYSAMFDLWQANLFNLTPAGSSTSPVHMTVSSQPGVPMSSRDLTPEERREVIAAWDARIIEEWGLVLPS